MALKVAMIGSGRIAEMKLLPEMMSVASVNRRAVLDWPATRLAIWDDP